MLFYGIYRLIWPSPRNVSSSGSGKGKVGSNGTGNSASAKPGSTPNQPYARAAEEAGEYIEYEEVR